MAYADRRHIETPQSRTSPVTPAGGLHRAAQAAGDVAGRVHGAGRHGDRAGPPIRSSAWRRSFAIAVGAGASGALNMWYDADIDGHHAAHRACGRCRPAACRRRGADLGLVLSVGSVTVLGLLANWLAAALLAFTIFFYAVVYTMWLKRWTPQNIVIGGAAGALPPVIGWAAVTGSVGIEPLVLFLIIFLWTPPHFWALSLYRPRTTRGPACRCCRWSRARRAPSVEILVYSVVLAPSRPPAAGARLRHAAYGIVAACLARCSSGSPSRSGGCRR
jgi:heme o synthase